MRALVILFALTLSAQNPFALTEADEIQLGKQAAGEIDKEASLITDPAIVKYIDDLGQSMVRKSPRANLQYTFKVVNSPEVNAFALPGGFIYVNRGLIEAADSENELAGVLGHEIGHVVLRHGAEQASRAAMAQLGIGALGAIVGHGKAASITEMGAQMATSGVFMKFSREAERAADRIGAQMVIDTGLQPQGMVSFFGKLAQLQQSQPNIVQKFFSSHPAPAERAQNISDMLAKTGPLTPAEPRDPQGFQQAKTLLAAVPRPEVETAKAKAALEAAAKPPAIPDAKTLSRDTERDRQIAARFAPIFIRPLGHRRDLTTSPASTSTGTGAATTTGTTRKTSNSRSKHAFTTQFSSQKRTISCTTQPSIRVITRAATRARCSARSCGSVFSSAANTTRPGARARRCWPTKTTSKACS